MIGSFSPFPIHCVSTNSIVCGRILLGPQRGHPWGPLHLLLIRGAAPQPRLSNLAARLRCNYVGLGVERGDRGVGVQFGVDRMGVGVLHPVFPYCGRNKGAVGGGAEGR